MDIFDLIGGFDAKFTSNNVISCSTKCKSEEIAQEFATRKVTNNNSLFLVFILKKSKKLLNLEKDILKCFS